jgi:multidrug resistance efflux pump
MIARSTPDQMLRLPPLPGHTGNPVGRSDGRWLVRVAVLLLIGMVAAAMVATGIEVDRVVRAAGQVSAPAQYELRIPDAVESLDLLVKLGDEVEAGQLLAVGHSPERVEDVRLARSRLLSLEFELAQEQIELAMRRERLGQDARSAELRLAAAHAAMRGSFADMGLPPPPDTVLAGHIMGSSVFLDRSIAAWQQAIVDVTVEKGREGQLTADSLKLLRLEHEVGRAGEALLAAEARLDRLSIRAPAAGSVVWDGPLVQHGERAQGEALFNIAAPGWSVHLLVSQREVGQVQPGQPVRLVAAALEAPFSATVVSVAPLPVAESAAAPVYRVVAAVEPAEDVRAGYTVEARIVTGTEKLLQSLLRRYAGR